MIGRLYLRRSPLSCARRLGSPWTRATGRDSARRATAGPHGRGKAGRRDSSRNCATPRPLSSKGRRNLRTSSSDASTFATGRPATPRWPVCARWRGSPLASRRTTAVTSTGSTGVPGTTSLIWTSPSPPTWNWPSIGTVDSRRLQATRVPPYRCRHPKRAGFRRQSPGFCRACPTRCR